MKQALYYACAVDGRPQTWMLGSCLSVHPRLCGRQVCVCMWGGVCLSKFENVFCEILYGSSLVASPVTCPVGTYQDSSVAMACDVFHVKAQAMFTHQWMPVSLSHHGSIRPVDLFLCPPRRTLGRSAQGEGLGGSVLGSHRSFGRRVEACVLRLPHRKKAS